MRPRARGRGQVATRRIPLHICHAVVVGRGEMLDARTPVNILLPLPPVVRVEVEVPELKFRLGHRTDRGKHDMSTAGRPADSVCRATSERLCRSRQLGKYVSVRGET